MICVVCQAPFGRPKKSKRRCCSRSCWIALSWRNPESAARRREGIRASKLTPEALAKTAAHNLRRWSKAGEREKLAEQNRREWADPVKRAKRAASIREIRRRPENRARSAEIKKQHWQDPSFRARVMAATAASHRTQTYRQRFSTILRERWKDPIWREKYIAGIRCAARRPEQRAKMSRLAAARWADPEYRRKMESAIEARSARLCDLWADPVFHEALAAKLAAARRSAKNAKPLGIIRAEDAADAAMAVIIDATGRVSAA